MELLYTILSVILVIDAILLIIVILMQKTKGAEVGAVFGAGAAAAVLGAGASTVLTKITYWLGGIFMALVLALSLIHHHMIKSSTVISDLPEQPVVPSSQQQTQQPVDIQIPEDKKEENPAK
ncbi:MAG: preprotein translocase subunit SecG [Aquificae bacterium]|nr:preprotein translocase subunit SecG [Aquificota bacterium]